MDLTQPILIPNLELWMPLLSALIVPWLTAAAVQSASDDDPAAEKWETRLRTVYAAAASVALVGVKLLMDGDEMPLGDFLTATVVTYLAQRGTWGSIKKFAVNPNKLLVPARGVDPVRVAVRASAFASRVRTAA